tara:strand:+ start:305 stop:451 length:147 start_codon:yes stop_codon:yes gene_type:complete
MAKIKTHFEKEIQNLRGYKFDPFVGFLKKQKKERPVRTRTQASEGGKK